jgi:adenosylhomocysteine nucleosidase
MIDTNINQGPVAVLCAMHTELDHLKALLLLQHEEWHDGRRYWVTDLGASPIILVCCGIGMANAASATEALIAYYHPIAILNYGCSGSHRLDVLPGDLVIGSRLVNVDRVDIEADGSEQYMGMYYLQADILKQVEYLPGSPMLLEQAIRLAAAREGKHEPWPLQSGWPALIPHRTPHVIVGTIATSDRWNRAPQRIQQIAALHDSICEDMEAAAIALICVNHEVPFLTIKDISNNELLRTTDEHFLVETTGQLGRRAAAFLFAFLLHASWPPKMGVEPA